MSSMQLTTNHISHPGPLPIPSPMASQTNRTGGGDDAGYVQNYMSLFPGQVAPSDQAVVSPVSQPLSHDPLAQCLSGQGMASAAPMVPSPLDNTSALVETVPPSVITHTASSTVKPSDAATTFSHGSEYSSISTQPPSQFQPLASLPTTSVQQPQTFAMPRPFQPSSANKNHPVQRIAAANTLPSSHLLLTGLLFLMSRSTYWFCIWRNCAFNFVDLAVELCRFNLITTRWSSRLSYSTLVIRNVCWSESLYLVPLKFSSVFVKFSFKGLNWAVLPLKPVQKEDKSLYVIHKANIAN